MHHHSEKGEQEKERGKEEQLEKGSRMNTHRAKITWSRRVVSRNRWASDKAGETNGTLK